MFQYVLWRSADPGDPLRKANEARAAAFYQALRRIGRWPGAALRSLRHEPHRSVALAHRWRLRTLTARHRPVARDDPAPVG